MEYFIFSRSEIIASFAIAKPSLAPAIDLDFDSKLDVDTTIEGLDVVKSAVRNVIPSLTTRNAITSFAGLRAHIDSDDSDFVIGPSKANPNFINVAGIESPGLASAPAIAEKVLEEKGIINAIIVKDKANNYSRKDLDKLTDYVKTYKASGLAYLKIDTEITGSIAKGLTDEEKNSLINTLNLENNDLVLIISGNKKIVKTSLGALRCKLAKDLELIKENDYKLLFITVIMDSIFEL